MDVQPNESATRRHHTHQQVGGDDPEDLPAGNCADLMTRRRHEESITGECPPSANSTAAVVIITRVQTNRH